MTDLQSPDTWKIQLTIAINFIFSKDSEKEREMCSTSDNIKFTFYSDVNKVVKEIFESLLHYKCHKVNFKRGRSYIDSTVRIKKKESNNESKN